MSRRAFSLLAVISLAGCFVALPAAQAGEVSHARIVRLSYTVGEVQSGAIGASGWQKAIANTPLREGMSLATGDGLAEVEFESGATAWMAANTVVEFPQLTLEDGAKNTQLAVKQGTATFYVNPDRHDSFVVQAGGLSIAVAENSRFRVDVFDDGASVSVLRGTLQVTEGGATSRVGSHAALTFRAGAPAGAVRSATPRSDAWDRWVSDRYSSAEAARLNATDHVNSPFGYGMADLGFYGGWVNLPGCGLGWQPHGVGAGWSPFSNGYWDGFGASGPTWISYEPWGWLPYHYGGWVNSPTYGWAWAACGFGPWSPGTVFWVRSGRRIGWVARAPREKVNGRPVNLTHGVVTNTPAGMLAGSKNTILRGAETAKLQMIGEWTGDAELGRISQQAEAKSDARTPAAGMANGVHKALRMPEGAAPRIKAAGIIAGHVVSYVGPTPPRGAGVSSGASASGVAGPDSSSGAASGAARGAAAPSHAAGGTGGASHIKP